MSRLRSISAAIVVAVLLAGCGGPMTLDGVTILRHRWLPGGPAALFTGTLHFRDGCAWGDWDNPAAESNVIVWPPDARLERSEGALVVIVGDVAIHDGESFSIGGGEERNVEWIRELAGSIPDACLADLYWLGGEVSRP